MHLILRRTIETRNKLYYMDHGLSPLQIISVDYGRSSASKQDKKRINNFLSDKRKKELFEMSRSRVLGGGRGRKRGRLFMNFIDAS